MQNKGFSLMEVVIVAAILAILAAIALPRLSRGSRGASDAALDADLTALQKAIDLFATEHGGQFPNADSIAGQLTQYTDRQGNPRDKKDSLHFYGPYLRAIPPLPVGPRRGNTKIGSKDEDGIGWIYNPESGQIRANLGLAEATAEAIEP